MASRREASCDLQIFSYPGKDPKTGMLTREIYAFCRRCMKSNETTITACDGGAVGPRSRGVTMGVNDLIENMCPPEPAPDSLDRMHD